MAGCVVSRIERNQLENKLYSEHVQRWNEILKNFEDELDECIKKEIRKHENKIINTKWKMKKDLVSLCNRNLSWSLDLSG